MLRHTFINLNRKCLHPKSVQLFAKSFSIFEEVEAGRLPDIKIENIRNFSVIAHVDHGKSTLSDCILQLTGNISEKDRKKGQVLDTLKVERERGITVKAQTASMIFQDPRTDTKYLLNLIDTPGHIDFSYEGTVHEIMLFQYYLLNCFSRSVTVSGVVSGCAAAGGLLAVHPGPDPRQPRQGARSGPGHHPGGDQDRPAQRAARGDRSVDGEFTCAPLIRFQQL